MHKKFQKFFKKSPPLRFCSKFPCDSRGGLRLSVELKFEGLEPKKWGILYKKWYKISPQNPNWLDLRCYQNAAHVTRRQSMGLSWYISMYFISLLYWFYGNHAAFWSHMKPSQLGFWGEILYHFFYSIPHFLGSRPSNFGSTDKRRPPRESQGNSEQNWRGGLFEKKKLKFFMHRILIIN